MKLFLISLACLCAVAFVSASVEEESYHRRDDVAKTDALKKQKKDIQRQTLTLANEDNKELNKENTKKFKKHGVYKEDTNKFNLKNQHKNTLTLQQEQEQDFEKDRKKTYRRTKDVDYRRRSASCSNSRENSGSGSNSSEGCRRCNRRRYRCGGWGGFNPWHYGFGNCRYHGRRCGRCRCHPYHY